MLDTIQQGGWLRVKTEGSTPPISEGAGTAATSYISFMVSTIQRGCCCLESVSLVLSKELLCAPEALYCRYVQPQ